MKLGEIIKIINGVELNHNGAHDYEIKGACGADLMSDVLATIQPDAILLTGLCNPQIIRTAQMADVRAIILVRGKNPPSETIQLASEEGIPLISTPFGMFEVCGRLYGAGLPSLENALA
jgi:predicted transcriptional regulator